MERERSHKLKKEFCNRIDYAAGFFRAFKQVISRSTRSSLWCLPPIDILLSMYFALRLSDAVYIGGFRAVSLECYKLLAKFGLFIEERPDKLTNDVLDAAMLFSLSAKFSVNVFTVMRCSSSESRIEDALKSVSDHVRESLSRL